MLTLAVEGAHAPMMQHIAPDDRSSGSTASSAIRRSRACRSVRAPPSRVASAAAAPVRPSFQPVELGDSLRSVGDPELRAVLESLAEGLSFTTGAPRLPEPSE